MEVMEGTWKPVALSLTDPGDDPLLPGPRFLALCKGLGWGVSEAPQWLLSVLMGELQRSAGLRW